MDTPAAPPVPENQPVRNAPDGEDEDGDEDGASEDEDEDGAREDEDEDEDVDTRRRVRDAA